MNSESVRSAVWRCVKSLPNNNCLVAFYVVVLNGTKKSLFHNASLPYITVPTKPNVSLILSVITSATLR